jgi:CheY-like chemotaxis protein
MPPSIEKPKDAGQQSGAQEKTAVMRKLLIVDDDESMRGMLCMRLGDSFQVIETGNPEQALGLALEHKPDAILLDLMMPKFSGFELCQSFRALSYTSQIPIFVISGEAGAKYREHCENLGAKGYFQKPVDFAALKEKLTSEIQGKQPDRRAHVRVRMRVILKLRGKDPGGNPFEETAATDNVSAGGFLCGCTAALVKGTTLDVFLAGDPDRFAGRARVVRREAPGAPWQQYGFEFVERTAEWVLQPS